MKIIVLPKGMSEQLMNDKLGNIHSVSWDAVKLELKLIDKDFQIEEINIGKGADCIAILVLINTIAGVFLLGDRIDKGIEGWINIGKRIKSIFKKSDNVYLDLDAAKIYTIQHLANKSTLTSFEIIEESSIELDNLSVMLPDRDESDFTAKPFSIYILTMIVNDKNKIILSVRSDGKINELLNVDKDYPTPF
ncbi:hypothetical protein [Bizionia paragorgiae]|uniref:Uncharacterized protein n=1 Tax=Bizionia paragorgiae TaxID=283786 RepID=A0A1H3YM98_BIZPA|nr:hypothetical protein [Bizionia paragorgiae]SEA12695.1 hypothetical protein SAMN04487990_1073 [Bizionia paragorgiae]